MIITIVLCTLVPIVSVSAHGNMVWPPTWQDAGGRIGASPGLSCAAGYYYNIYGDQGKTGAICLWYTNYTMKVGETTIDESMRTFANIEPMYEGYVKNNPWMAPGSAKVFSGCGIAGGKPLGCPEGSPSLPGMDCDPYGGGYSYEPRAEDFDN